MGEHDVGLLGGVAQSRGDLAAKAKPDEPLHEQVESEQQRQRADDQLAPHAHAAQRLDPDSRDHRPCSEVSLRREAHRRLTLTRLGKKLVPPADRFRFVAVPATGGQLPPLSAGGRKQ